jgi:hypothetical protein
MPLTATAKLLQAGAILLIVFGLATALAAHPVTAGITRFLADLIIWPVDGRETLASPDARLLAAIGGGLMAGWGLMIWLVAGRLYPRDPELARTLILASVAAWFVIDSLGSVAAGAPLNAVLNVVFLLVFWLPLRRRRELAAG